jgi:hypothetical protein
MMAEDPDDPNARRGSHLVQATVYLTPEAKRKRTAAKIIDALKKETKTAPGLTRLSYEKVRPGPPVG